MNSGLYPGKMKNYFCHPLRYSKCSVLMLSQMLAKLHAGLADLFVLKRILIFAQFGKTKLFFVESLCVDCFDSDD